MTSNARRLRQQSTDVEAKLWRALRRNQISGLSFRRQHPVGPYVLDFYCPALRLAIEIDGGQHALPQQQYKDERRSRWLASKGIEVLRFWNNDVSENFEGVLSEITRIATAKVETPSPPLPLSGGGSREAAP